VVVQLALLVKPALFLFQQLVQLIHESHKPLGVLLNENLLAKPLPLLFMSLSSAGACIDRRGNYLTSSGFAETLLGSKGRISNGWQTPN